MPTKQQVLHRIKGHYMRYKKPSYRQFVVRHTEFVSYVASAKNQTYYWRGRILQLPIENTLKANNNCPLELFNTVTK
jgi:hypothetical protein